LKIWWGSSVGRSYEPDHVTSIVNLLAHNPYPMYWKPIHGDALIERSRSRSATAFLDSDAEVFLTVDTDIVFYWKDAVTLCEQAVSHSLVVGAYATRSALRSFVTSALEPHKPVEFASDSTPVPIQWGATGFMAVHRRVFEKMAKTMPLCHRDEPDMRHYPFFLPFVHDVVPNYPILLSEDYAFTEHAKLAGFPPYLNPAIRVGHLGPYCYRLEDLVAERPALLPMLRVTRMNEGAPAQYRVEQPDREEPRATEEGKVAEDDLSQHSDRSESRPTRQAGSRDRVQRGWQVA
jgi:hypothetical protein